MLGECLLATIMSACPMMHRTLIFVLFFSWLLKLFTVVILTEYEETNCMHALR